MKISFIALSILIVVTVTALAMSEKPGPCEGRQWKNSKEQLDCKYPYPPIGRWHAVYTKEFAETHNLPPENISTDISPGVDYIEMDVQPFGNGGTACMVNMLIKKPHDVALYGGDKFMPGLPEDRKLIHLIDLDHYKDQLRPIISFNFVSRDYLIGERGFRSSTFAIYAEDVLPGYDYIAANAECRHVSMKPQYFPGGYALWPNKASVWGKYKRLYKSYNDPERPKGMDFYNSHLFINIPHELVSTIFKDVPLGGR